MATRIRRAPAAGLLLLAGLALPALAGSKHLDLKFSRFDPTTASPALPARLRLATEPESGYFIVQFHEGGGAKPLAGLRAIGVEPLHYVPEDAYLVRLPAGSKTRVRQMRNVRWLGAVQPAWKIAPDLGEREFVDPGRRRGGMLTATVDLFPGEELTVAASDLQAIGVEVIQTHEFGGTRRVKVRGTRLRIEAAASLPAVSWIEEFPEMRPRNDDAAWVLQSDIPDTPSVWNRGLHGEGQIIGHIDRSLDINSCYFRDPLFVLPGPGHRKVVAYRSSVGLGAEAHGTHTAGSAAGDQTLITGATEGNGLAYAARLSHSNLDDITDVGVQPSNLYDYLQAAHADGARIHTNSWGDDGSTSYGTWSRDIDAFAHDFEESLLLFAVTNGPELRVPENAKNALAVAATDNGLAGDSYCSGGIGPTSDFRRKPDIMAPGCGVRSARSGFACATIADSGTSMATGTLAGAAALTRQYFVDGWYPTGTERPGDGMTPSAALVKATIVNSAIDVTGITGYPGNSEGWGRAVIERALFFDGDIRKLSVLADLFNSDGLVTGEHDEFRIDVDGDDEPFELTVVFTDPPGALMAAQAAVNNVNLELTSPTGRVYLGNRFADGQSAEGGRADERNSVENARLVTPEIGQWRARVRGAGVNQGSQGYALVATGELTAPPGGRLRYTGRTVLDPPPLGNNDGFADPGETITLGASVINRSPGPATGVSGKLISVTPADAQVSGQIAGFPDAAAGGAISTDAPHFTLTIPPGATCGADLEFELDVGHTWGESRSLFTLPVGNQANCSPFDCGGDPVPGEVGTAVTLEVENGVDIRFGYSAVAGATAYRIWRSATPDFLREDFLGVTTALSFVELGGVNDPASWYYRVRAVNSCNWEGP